MTARLRAPLAACLTLALAAVTAACGSAAGASSTTGPSQTTTGTSSDARGSKVPAKDSFHGRIASGTRRYARSSGRFAIALYPAPGESTRPMKAVARGRLCRRSCARMRLSLTGSITSERPIHPDLASRFTVQGSGANGSLGPFTATGTGHGTGFIRGGREQLELTIKTRHGRFVIEAESGPVPAFSSP